MNDSNEASSKPISAMRAGTWTMASRVLGQLIQFAIFILVARWVEPDAFGLYALVAACVVILNQLASAGWPEYIMQSEINAGGLSSALLVAIGFGVGVAVIGVTMAMLAGFWINQPTVIWIAVILSASIAFSSSAAAYAGVLNRQNKLEAAAACTLLSEVTNFAATIWSLNAGHGVVALAIGRLAASVVWACSAAICSRLRPAASLDWVLAKEMVLFSKHIILTKVMYNLRVYSSTFIIGGFVGPAAVGFFRAAQRLVTAFEEVFGEPTRLLAWSMFRSVREDAEGDRTGNFDAFSQLFFRVQLYCVVPVFIGLAILGQDLLVGLLGDEWAPAGPVLQILAIVGLIRLPGQASVPILSLAGRTELLPRTILVYSLVTLICILVAARHGIIAIALAEMVAALIIFLINMEVMRRFANIYWGRILKGSWRMLPPLVSTFLICALFLQLDFVEQLHPLTRFFTVSALIIALYAPAVLWIDKSARGLLFGNTKIG